MKLRQLRYFQGAVENGSFRRAAKALGVRESTVSRAIRDLEDELGASLFHRQAGGVSLTVAGERFVQRARIVFQQIGDGAQAVSEVGRCENGFIRVGIHSSLASGFLAELLRKFGRDHSGIWIDLIDGSPSEHVATIRRLQLDVAFLAGTRAWVDCEAEVLWSEKVFVAFPQNHALKGKAEIDWCDIEGEQFIASEMVPGSEVSDCLVQRLAVRGRRPDVRLCKLDRHNLLSLVGLGRGLTLTSQATTVSTIPGVIYRPIDGEILSFSAVWSPRNDNPALRCLLSMARQMSAAAS